MIVPLLGPLGMTNIHSAGLGRKQPGLRGGRLGHPHMISSDD